MRPLDIYKQALATHATPTDTPWCLRWYHDCTAGTVVALERIHAGQMEQERIGVFKAGWLWSGTFLAPSPKCTNDTLVLPGLEKFTERWNEAVAAWWWYIKHDECDIKETKTFTNEWGPKVYQLATDIKDAMQQMLGAPEDGTYQGVG